MGVASDSCDSDGSCVKLSDSCGVHLQTILWVVIGVRYRNLKEDG